MHTPRPRITRLSAIERGHSPLSSSALEPLPQHVEAPPRRIGRYTVLADLARGGMAHLMVAQRDGSPEICVLKELLGELRAHEIAGKRFVREAQLASYLDHPNIARVLDAGMEDDTFCIATEFIAGSNVEDLMRQAAMQGRILPYELSLAVVLGALRGLEYAHDAVDPSGRPLELIHRDLSPRNLMLSFDGELKIIDFGVARGSVDDFRTAPGMIVGTLRYVSPEQAVAEPLDRRSDLYALGVVLYELLTGRPLVPEGSPIAVLNDVLHRRVRPASVINPHLPLGLDGVLALALAKDREQRFPSARAMREAIEAVVGDLGRTAPERVGAYVVDACPEAYTQARELRALGALRYAEWAAGGPSGVSRNTLTPPRPRAVPDDRYELTPTEDHVPTAVDHAPAPAAEHITLDASPSATSGLSPDDTLPPDDPRAIKALVDLIESGQATRLLMRPEDLFVPSQALTTVAPAVPSSIQPRRRWDLTKSAVLISIASVMVVIVAWVVSSSPSEPVAPAPPVTALPAPAARVSEPEGAPVPGGATIVEQPSPGPGPRRATAGKKALPPRTKARTKPAPESGLGELALPSPPMVRPLEVDAYTRLGSVVDRAHALIRQRPDDRAQLEAIVTEASGWMTSADADRAREAAVRLEAELAALVR